jgi:hypothetical protein
MKYGLFVDAHMAFVFSVQRTWVTLIMVSSFCV